MHFDLQNFSHRLQKRNPMRLRGNISRYLRIWVVPLTKRVKLGQRRTMLTPILGVSYGLGE